MLMFIQLRQNTIQRYYKINYEIQKIELPGGLL